MKNGDIRVLLLGENPGRSHRLRKCLERRRCRCRIVRSYAEAQRVLKAEKPDIVLSAIPPKPGAIAAMTDCLRGSRTSFYYAYPVENSCWWLPALHRGERRLGAPAMRPGQFSDLLDQVVEEIRNERELERSMAPKPIPIRKAHPHRPEVLAFTKAAG